jgi:ribonuclease BN (tRNA processing enzyme)
MKITFGGSRGTRPLHDQQFARFGGATTSILVQGDAGDMVVIDCGSGLANIETEVLTSHDPLLILFTHLHLDHMMGLPSFRALHQEGRQIFLAGPDQTAAACHGLFSKPYWPLKLDEMAADIRHQPLQPIHPGNEKKPTDSETLVWGQLTIKCMKVNHPGGCLAYRIDEQGTGNSFLLATDMEWHLMKASHQERFQALGTNPNNATVFAMDGHFSQAEYTDRTGWGHSTQEEVVKIGQAMGCEHILITHHSPENNDEELDKRRLAVKAMDKRADLIAQGLKVELS